MTSISHDDLVDSLAGHLATERRMVWRDMQLGPSGSIRPDVYTIDRSFHHPNPTAYECKATRSDFLHDASEAKYAKYFMVAGAVIFAAPKGLIQPSELPGGVGLIVLHPSGTWRLAKRAIRQKVTIPEKTWLKLVIDGVHREGPPARARAWALSVVEKKVGQKLGQDVADILRDRQKARVEIEWAESEAARIRNTAEVAAEKAKQTAESHFLFLRRILGLPPDSTTWDIERALRAIQWRQQSEPMDEILMALRQVVARFEKQA